MIEVAWATDVHFDHVKSEAELDSFVAKLTGYDAVFITGDISAADKICDHMKMVADRVKKPVYFVLGNHDFYGSSIAYTRKIVTNLCKQTPELTYLTTSGFVMLSESTAVVGHDGWYDMNVKAGGVTFVKMLMSDWMYVDEFTTSVTHMGMRSQVDVRNVVAVCSRLAYESATYVRAQTLAAVANGAKHVVVLTHVPPWRECHTHMGKPSNADFHPYFTSQVMGDTLLEIAAENPDVEFTVLAGHTHGKASKKIEKNMMCFVQGAEYGYPTHEGITVK